MKHRRIFDAAAGLGCLAVGWHSEALLVALGGAVLGSLIEEFRQDRSNR